MKLAERIILVCVVLALVLVAGAVWAYATNGFDIRACYNNSSGVLRIVEDVSECRDQETGLEWNIQGPQGPQGDPGPQGLKGDPGPQGPPGVLGFYTKDKWLINILPGWASTQAFCDTGDRVTGGGFNVSQDCVDVTESRPLGENTWFVRIHNRCDGYIAYRSYVICADFEPPHQ